jgi:hypothetical protein
MRESLAARALLHYDQFLRELHETVRQRVRVRNYRG